VLPTRTCTVVSSTDHTRSPSPRLLLASIVHDAVHAQLFPGVCKSTSREDFTLRRITSALLHVPVVKLGRAPTSPFPAPLQSTIPRRQVRCPLACAVGGDHHKRFPNISDMLRSRQGITSSPQEILVLFTALSSRSLNSSAVLLQAFLPRAPSPSRRRSFNCVVSHARAHPSSPVRSTPHSNAQIRTKQQHHQGDAP